MNSNNNHKYYLNKKDYLISQEILIKLDADDINNIKKYGYWLNAFEKGKIIPTSNDQELFLKVCKGSLTPQNEIQRSWVKFTNIRNSLIKPKKKYKKRKGLSAAAAKKKSSKQKAEDIEKMHKISGYHNQTTKIIYGSSSGSKR